MRDRVLNMFYNFCKRFAFIVSVASIIAAILFIAWLVITAMTTLFNNIYIGWAASIIIAIVIIGFWRFAEDLDKREK